MSNILPDHQPSDKNLALDVLQSFNTSIGADATHVSSMTQDNLMYLVGNQSYSTGSIGELANMQNMLMSSADSYNTDTADMIRMIEQKNINYYALENTGNEVSRVKKLRQTTENNVKKSRVTYLSTRYAIEQNKYTTFIIQLSFWAEVLVFATLTLCGMGKLSSLWACLLLVTISILYCVVMYKMLKQTKDRRSDVFNKFYWSSTDAKSS